MRAVSWEADGADRPFLPKQKCDDSVRRAFIVAVKKILMLVGDYVEVTCFVGYIVLLETDWERA